jgi:hypothetical protein
LGRGLIKLISVSRAEPKVDQVDLRPLFASSQRASSSLTLLVLKT